VDVLVVEEAAAAVRVAGDRTIQEGRRAGGDA
jgi:hypothetical protein